MLKAALMPPFNLELVAMNSVCRRTLSAKPCLVLRAPAFPEASCPFDQALLWPQHRFLRQLQDFPQEARPLPVPVSEVL